MSLPADLQAGAGRAEQPWSWSCSLKERQKSSNRAGSFAAAASILVWAFRVFGLELRVSFPLCLFSADFPKPWVKDGLYGEPLLLTLLCVVQLLQSSLHCFKTFWGFVLLVLVVFGFLLFLFFWERLLPIESSTYLIRRALSFCKKFIFDSQKNIFGCQN